HRRLVGSAYVIATPVDPRACWPGHLEGELHTPSHGVRDAIDVRQQHLSAGAQGRHLGVRVQVIAGREDSLTGFVRPSEATREAREVDRVVYASTLQKDTNGLV